MSKLPLHFIIIGRILTLMGSWQSGLEKELESEDDQPSLIGTGFQFSSLMQRIH